jgi:serine/threonine protein kinase
MELCHTNLEHYIQKRGGFLPEAEAKYIITKIVEGLKLTNSLGCIHMDLKPENVMIVFEGL